MAKIILMTGTHPNEKAAIEIAKPLKKDLESRGHEVLIHNIPYELTNKGVIEKIHVTKEEALSPIKDLVEHERRLREKNPTAHIISLHNSPVSNMFAQNKKPGKLSARSSNLIDTNIEMGDKGVPPLSEISKELPNPIMYIELPAYYKRTPHLMGMWDKAHKRVHWEADEDKYKLAFGFDADFGRDYFEREVDLKETKNSGLLSPPIVRKVGHLIHTHVQTREGKFKIPRAKPFKTKAELKSQRVEKSHRR